MNYRHAYHAGNFADVLKHALLCWIVRYLQQKEAPLALIDTHAGAGVYDLTAPEAAKTGEAKDGILRLLARTDAPAALTPYLDLVRAINKTEPDPRLYPGSPALMTALARANDRTVAVELHPEDAAGLKETLKAKPRLQIVTGDGYRTLLKQVPPPEKRGIVLIDPPFEAPDEFEQLAKAFIAAHRKWPTGVYMLWFPIKHPDDAARFTAELMNAVVPRLTLIAFDVARPEGLSAAGLVLCNAPYTLEAEWRDTLPWLAKTLAQGPAPSSAIENLGAA
jgi:23S rRNA (adenine2030-N6)-methyltransferase